MNSVNQESGGLAGGRSAAIRRDYDSARIQTLRGVACMLLVGFHVIGLPSSGLRVPDQSIWRFFTEIFEPLRMPLFTFLSGFVYAYRPVVVGMGAGFVGKKTRRLLLPLISVATIHFLVQKVVPGTNARTEWADMWKIYVFPYEHFWFLQAIALIFLLVAVLDHLQLLDNLGAFFVALCLALLAHLAMATLPSFFSLGKAAYLLPFFVAGLGANRFKRELWSTPWRILAPTVFAATMAPYAILAWTAGADVPGGATPWVTLISMSGIFTLMFFLPPVVLLGWIGGYSFSIYLFHVFFTAGARIALSRIGDLPIEAFVFLGLVAGIAGPIVVEIVLRPNRFARNILLGQS